MGKDIYIAVYDDRFVYNSLRSVAFILLDLPWQVSRISHVLTNGCKWSIFGFFANGSVFQICRVTKSVIDILYIGKNSISKKLFPLTQ